ncbi:MAG TPA: class I SAM-dependent methyltransferase [Acidobacteriaceae bacterium]|nr:class I SAM-dependent methyltransferase [Acidobacteriaceae bacterium]
MVSPPTESLFERCHWLYAFCREHLFKDQTPEISRSLFPPGGPVQGARLLELGCGPGVYACRFAQKFPQIAATGIDLSKRLLSRARSRARSLHLHNCSFLEGDAQSLADLPQSVDAVIVSRLFLIVPDRGAVIAEIFRVLRPGGRCFIAEPTSGFTSRLPLTAMWLFARFGKSPVAVFREPEQVEVMSFNVFSELIHGQPWASATISRDDWYQYAVCEKSISNS